jgi:hypothetical protein
MNEDKDTKYTVFCEKCAEVTFEVLDDEFRNKSSALWYAGYHSGKEHPESDFQESFPKEK